MVRTHNNNIGTYVYNRDKEKIPFDASYWWLSPKGDCHNQVFENAKQYFQRWSANYFELVNHQNRYEERNTILGNVSPWAKLLSSRSLSANPTAMTIDTLVSKVAKAIPSVEYLTSGGNWQEQQQAKDLQKYVTGVFLNHNVHANARTMFGDGCKEGNGVILLDDYNGQLCYYNYPAHAVMCDWLDAQSGMPTDIHFLSLVSRFKLMQMYPEYKDKLMHTSNSMHFYNASTLNSKDCVVLLRSYNMFARRRTLCVDNCTLRDDDTLMGENGLTNYKGEAIPPVVNFIYKESSLGFFSIGVAEEIRPLHIATDNTLRTIQRIQYLGSTPNIWVNRSANVVEALLQNEIGNIMLYDGPASNVPVSSPLLTIPADLYKLVQYYLELCFKKVGLSELTATSQKPAGLNSGKALSTYFDIEADRFQSTSKLYERAIIDLNYLTVKYSRYLQNMGYHQKAKFYGHNLQKEIDFAKVDLDEEYFDIQAYPVSIIPQTPSGKYQTVRDMLQLGIVDQQRTMKLLDLPDIEGDNQLENSKLDYARYQIYEIMNGNLNISPDIRQDLDLLLSQCEKHYFLFKQKNVDPEALIRLDEFIGQVETLRDKRNDDASKVAQAMLEQQMQQEEQQKQIQQQAPQAQPQAA